MSKYRRSFVKEMLPPYERVKLERPDPLLQAFGSDRLLFGTDFPFVLEQNEQYKGTVGLVSSWLAEDEKGRAAVMGGTAERLFGPWGIKKDEL